MINQLVEFCKYLGLVILILILVMIIVALLQTFVDNIKKRKKRLQWEKQFEEDVLKTIQELTKSTKTTKTRTKKDSD